MSWKERLREKIVFASPGGTRFEGKWRGDDVTVTKRVARHAHPDMDYEVAQDMGLQSPDFPLTFYFDGKDHDLTGRKFAECLGERGVWQVVHPVLGPLALQPEKLTFSVRPVESANVTEISGEWFMPAGETASIADIPTALEKAKDGVSAAAVEDAVRMPVDNAAKQKSAIEQFKKGYQAAKKTIRAVNDRINGITNTINDLANQTTLEVASISGAVIQLLQSPGLFLGNCAARVQQFVILARRIMADLPAAISFSADRIAAAMTGELWLSAIAAGMGTAILENPPSTRAEALTVLRLYRECADESRAALDALAEATRGEPLRNQYAPGAASTEALLRLRAAVQRYLIGAAYSLSSERRITLESDRSPLELCVTEMGASSGDFDQKYAALCSWNNWHGRDLLLVGRGKEAAIYD